ncbi:MAG: ATP-binding cassette domain-containing protein, partial [Candidatus Cloacimonadaceae bacterium]|nr:ATP-binding cassette domain-containing protein [Candidatus Cloacimonadaceae bacterium]
MKIYGRRTVVNDLSMEINQGEVVGILGPNGAGKTTTFYMIIGLAKPNKGKVMLNDKDITHRPMYKRARLGIGYLAQAP